MVNKENINKVIAAIRDEDNFFNMGTYEVTIHFKEKMAEFGTPIDVECGTPACICGWAYHIMGNRNLTPKDANEFFGIDTQQGVNLYGLCGSKLKDLIDITRQQAIATLERLRDTGEVRWEFLP